MALYIGKNKVKIMLDGKAYFINTLSSIPVAIGKKIVLLNNEILKDLNNQYITLKKENEL